MLCCRLTLNGSRFKRSYHKCFSSGVIFFLNFLRFEPVFCYMESFGHLIHRSPLVYHEAARRLGAAPREIAVYEDALYAVQTAKAAGFHVVGVYDDSAADSWQAIEQESDEVVLNWEEAV